MACNGQVHVWLRFRAVSIVGELERKITALQVQKRNPNRVNVYLDGEFAFGLARIVAAWLQIDQRLSPGKIADLQAQDSGEVALQRALNLLSYRPRSESELSEALRKHEISPEIIQSTLARLRENHLLDDPVFARKWVENRTEFRPRGARLLRLELRRKGVREEHIAPALAGLDETSLAYQAAAKKFSRQHFSDPAEFRKKVYSFLARRGFQYDQIRAAADQLWRELTNPTEELR